MEAKDGAVGKHAGAVQNGSLMVPGLAVHTVAICRHLGVCLPACLPACASLHQMHSCTCGVQEASSLGTRVTVVVSHHVSAGN